MLKNLLKQIKISSAYEIFYASCKQGFRPDLDVVKKKSSTSNVFHYH